ncbi:MAG: helix-turn-helix domain-containing protein [bacterium]|nr:helix-turn-helix domain-containing protein [bacterium]
MHSTILHELQTLGLNDKEASVYEALLAMKKGTALSLAQRAHIKRPTTYHVLASLQDKGLVVCTTFRGVKDYRALPVPALKKYIKNQQRLVEHEFPQMETLYEKRKNKLRLRVYHDIASLKTLFEKSLREKSRMHIIGNEAVFTQHLGGYWQFYMKRSRQRGIAPIFKPCNGAVSLLVWSDKVVFTTLEGTVRVFGFRNKQLHNFYFELWKNF